MNGIETRFKIGNKEAEKWTFEEVEKLFEKMYDLALTDSSILCFQGACLAVNYRSSHVDYFIKKFPVFENTKKDIQNVIVNRVNEGALKGTLVSTPAIFRMKQLGEVDESNYNMKNNGGSFETTVSQLSTDELVKRAEALKVIESQKTNE
jgi:hypothetical protein